MRTRIVRKGYTLLEIMIVTTIMLVMIALLSSAVGKVTAVAKRTANMSDIHQLDIALANFKVDYGFHPPSLFRVYNDYPDNRYQVNQLDTDSTGFAQKVFGKLTGMQWANPLNPLTPPDGFCVPLASVTPVPPNLPYWELEGDQCLVLFLGGKPVGNDGASIPGTVGFDLTVSRVTRPAYYQFQPSRLVLRRKTFFSYLDRYGDSDNLGGIPDSNPALPGFRSDYSKVYMYFRATTQAYTHSVMIPLTTASTTTVFPYYLDVNPPPRWHGPNTYQILSAGPDRKFGAKIDWYVNNLYPFGTDGFDDQTNFADRPLGVGN